MILQVEVIVLVEVMVLVAQVVNLEAVEVSSATSGTPSDRKKS